MGVVEKAMQAAYDANKCLSCGGSDVMRIIEAYEAAKAPFAIVAQKLSPDQIAQLQRLSGDAKIELLHDPEPTIQPIDSLARAKITIDNNDLDRQIESNPRLCAPAEEPCDNNELACAKEHVLSHCAPATDQPVGLSVSDYEEISADHRRLVRELDVALNGEEAAPQASLCDIVAQVKERQRKTHVVDCPCDGNIKFCENCKPRKPEREAQQPVDLSVDEQSFALEQFIFNALTRKACPPAWMEIATKAAREWYMANAKPEREYSNPQGLLDSWQPIDTAPRDYRWIVIAAFDDDDRPDYVVGSRWEGDKEGVRGFWQCWKGNAPTHWMPMPAYRRRGRVNE